MYNYKYEYWKNKVIVVDIYDVEKETEKGITYTVKYNKDKFLIYIQDKEKVYKYGDKLKILCSNYEQELLNNPYEFNYKRYLNSKGYIARINVAKVLSVDNFNGNLNIVYNIREKISRKIDNNLSYIQENIFKSIIYGEDKYLDEDFKKKVSDAGLGHILCVSGSHVIFLLSSFEKITKSKSKTILSCIILLYFYIISLFKTSLLRAICMKIFSLVFPKKTFIEKYIVTLIITLCINPWYIFNVGIILSFLSVLSIHIFNSLIYSKIQMIFNPLNTIDKAICESIATTISAQILIIPVTIYYFGNVSLISIFSNFYTIFVISLILKFGFTFFILAFIPVISNGIIYICNTLLTILILQINFLDSINYFNIKLPKPDIISIISYYLLVGILIYSKKIILISWKHRKKLRVGLYVIKIICISWIIISHVYTMYIEKYVIFFNVGQGNMALIHKYNCNVLIDCGSTVDGRAGYILSNYLKALNIQNIDCIFLTHMHADHVNGVDDLLENEVNIERIAYSIPFEGNEEYENIMKCIKNNNISKMQVIQDECININGVGIQVLLPPNNKVVKSSDMLNANSCVYKVNYKNINMLFMGDATKEAENYLLDKDFQDIDIIQIGHHGSKTSSSESFISSFKTGTIGIISADKNVYGHPHKETLDVLNKYSIKYYLTQENCAIKYILK